MGLIDMIKPLSTVLSSAINKSQQHQEKNSWERRESNPVLTLYLYCLVAKLSRQTATFPTMQTEAPSLKTYNEAFEIYKFTRVRRIVARLRKLLKRNGLLLSRLVRVQSFRPSREESKQMLMNGFKLVDSFRSWDAEATFWLVQSPTRKPESNHINKF